MEDGLEGAKSFFDQSFCVFLDCASWCVLDEALAYALPIIGTVFSCFRYVCMHEPIMYLQISYKQYRFSKHELYFSSTAEGTKYVSDRSLNIVPGMYHLFLLVYMFIYPCCVEKADDDDDDNRSIDQSPLEETQTQIVSLLRAMVPKTFGFCWSFFPFLHSALRSIGPM